MKLDSEHSGQSPAPRATLLMICYYFPPILTTGSNRSAAFASLLPQFAWRPVVLSVKRPQEEWDRITSEIPEYPEVEIHRSAETNISRLLDFFHAIHVRVLRLFRVSLRRNWFRELIAIPDSHITWWVSLKGLPLARRADAIYVSCSPFSAALSGVFLKLVSGKPLVLDFRDAWTLNPHLRRPSAIVARLSRGLERFALSHCNHLIVNTDGAKRLYEQHFPIVRGKISCIPNGYDSLTSAGANDPEIGIDFRSAHSNLPSPVSGEDLRTASEPFVIMHVGSFYGARQPDALLRAIAELKPLSIRFVQVGTGLDDCAKLRNDIPITIYDVMPRDAALRMMSLASLLYLKQGFEPDVKHYIAVAAKTYEYIASGRPLLADVPEGDNADIVRRYAQSAYIVNTNSVADLKSAIEQAYRHRNSVRVGVSEDFAQDFDRKRLARQLADTLTSLLDARVNAMASKHLSTFR